MFTRAVPLQGGAKFPPVSGPTLVQVKGLQATSPATHDAMHILAGTLQRGQSQKGYRTRAYL